jgi:hypothetical protein
LDQNPKGKMCHGMQGVSEEGAELIGEAPPPAILDAGLISAAQHVEHYEMAGYASVRDRAPLLGHGDQAKMLQQTLDEEMATGIVRRRPRDRAATGQVLLLLLLLLFQYRVCLFVDFVLLGGGHTTSLFRLARPRLRILGMRRVLDRIRALSGLGEVLRRQRVTTLLVQFRHRRLQCELTNRSQRLGTPNANLPPSLLPDGDRETTSRD